MRTSVISTCVVEGFHRWPDHQRGHGFLAERHRHLFKIKVETAVNHDDRDIEFIEHARLVASMLRSMYGSPCEFGSLSCEMIAKSVIKNFPNTISCEVWEDDENGARVVT